MMVRVSEIAAASPEMGDAEFAALKEDIRRFGQRVPIVVMGDEVIDGRKRLRACQELGVEVKSVSLGSDQDPVIVARSLNILRTHYTPSQRAMYAAKIATRPRGLSKPSSPNLVMVPPTIAEVGKRIGASTGAILQARAIRRTAPPEVVRAVEEGKLTLHAAEQIVKRFPPSDQARVTAQAIAQGRGARRRSILPQEHERRRPVRPKADQFEEAIRTASVAIEIIERCADSLRNDNHWASWERELRRLRSVLSRAINGKGGKKK